MTATNQLPAHSAQHASGGVDAIPAGGISDTQNSNQVEHYRKFLYDFSVLGGAVSTLTLTDDAGAAATIPAYSTITQCAVRVITGVTGGAGATLAVGYTGSTGGILAATLVTGLTAGVGIVTLPTLIAPIVVGASPVSCTASIAVNAATAGKLVVFVKYFSGTATL